jgi:CRP/FNR family transcriptional regulator, cyclic AMP receptor protein
MRRERAASLLAATPLFSGLSQPELLRLVEAAAERNYARGQFLFHQGDPGDRLFVIVEGLVKVMVTSPAGEKMILAALRPPDVFGELAMIDGGARSASIQAVESTTVLTLTRATLLDLLATRPQLGDVLLRSLGGLIRRLIDQTADLVFLDLHGRVAKLLVGLASAHAQPRGGGLVLDLRLTQTDLAAMVGGSRQSVNQILQQFERWGYLERRGRMIVLKDLEALRRRAEPPC